MHGAPKRQHYLFSFTFKLDWSVANAWFVGLESKEWVEENQLSSIFFFLSFFFFWFDISYSFSSSLGPRK